MRYVIALFVAFAMLFSSGTFAAPQLSKQDQQILKQLSPAARKEVVSRLSPGETVEGILEVMVLNRLSLLFAEGRVESVDVIKGEAVIVYPDGRRETKKFVLDEIILKQ